MRIQIRKCNYAIVKVRYVLNVVFGEAFNRNTSNNTYCFFVVVGLLSLLVNKNFIS